MGGLVGAFVFSYLLILGFFLMPALLLGLAIPYGILRLRDTREEHSDPQVGIKCALYFFYSLGILLILQGATVVVVDLVTGDDNPQQLFPWQNQPQQRPAMNQAEEEFPNTAQRTGGALAVSGLLFLVIHLAYIKLVTNDRQFPAAGRIFLGWRLAIHGLIVFWTVTFLLVIQFQEEESPAEVTNFLIGTLLVWMPSWFVHLTFLRASKMDYYTPPRKTFGRGRLHEDADHEGPLGN